jgi:hypothetical protein
MKCLNSFYLKIIALILMTIDHIGFIFDLPITYRIIGRLSFPLFAFLIYQGYQYTRSRKRYFLRLFIFGVSLELGLWLISLFMPVPLGTRNIFLTLSFGVLGLAMMDTKFNPLLKIVSIGYLLYISTLYQFDYSWYGILFILSFKFYPRYFYISIFIQIGLAYLQTLTGDWTLQYYAILSWLFIACYNHQKGYSLKYLFYVYYPLHLAILFLIAEFLI